MSKNTGEFNRLKRYFKHLEAGTLDDYYDSTRRPGRKLKKYTKGLTREGGQTKFSRKY